MGERGELPLASPSPVPGHLFKIGVTSINSSTPGGGMTCSFHKTCRQIIITGFRNLILSTLGGFTYIRHGFYCGGWIWGLWGVDVLWGGSKQASWNHFSLPVSRTSALLNISPDASRCYTALGKRREATHNAMKYVQCIEATSFLVLLRKDKSDNLNLCRRIVGGCWEISKVGRTKETTLWFANVKFKRWRLQVAAVACKCDLRWLCCVP